MAAAGFRGIGLFHVDLVVAEREHGLPDPVAARRQRPVHPELALTDCGLTGHDDGGPTRSAGGS